MKIGEAISSLNEIKLSEQQHELNRVKCQKFESHTYKALHDEYIELRERTEPGRLPPFLIDTNKVRMDRIEGQLKSLARQSQNATPDVDDPNVE